LRTTRVCVKAREVFTAGELEARIVAHAERVLREEVVSPDDAKRRQTGREGNGRRKSC
jgi:hypothetical protein